MIVLNFGHPLTASQIEQIEVLAGQKVGRVTEINSQIDPQQPLGPQVVALADQAGLSPPQWQTDPLLINPPSLNFLAVTLLAELHGRMGYFPACLRLRPIPESMPPGFEVAEILNLQAIRDAARQRERTR